MRREGEKLRECRPSQEESTEKVMTKGTKGATTKIDMTMTGKKREGEGEGQGAHQGEGQEVHPGEDQGAHQGEGQEVHPGKGQRAHQGAGQEAEREGGQSQIQVKIGSITVDPRGGAKKAAVKI